MTITPPYWVPKTFHKHTWQHRISLVEGLEVEHMRSHSYGRDDSWAEVDASIAPIIVALNQRGHHTLFCCSGLPEDHQNTTPSTGPTAGYLLFAAPVPPDLFPQEIVVSWSGSHIQFPRDANAARVAWNHLARALGVELA